VFGPLLTPGAFLALTPLEQRVIRDGADFAAIERARRALWKQL